MQIGCIGLSWSRDVMEGDDLVHLAIDAGVSAGNPLADGDVVVFCQKVVSKAEGRLINLASVTPSAEATRLGALTLKDPRLVELVLGESSRVVRAKAGVLVVRHRLGFTMANAGIDQSNLQDGENQALLLPVDPDGSARELRTRFGNAGVRVAVLINDSFGRPWRRGTCGAAIGCAGLPALIDLRGRPDRMGRLLQHSETALGDELAATASLVMGQGGQGRPVAVIRGLADVLDPEDRGKEGEGAAVLVRPEVEDLFR